MRSFSAHSPSTPRYEGYVKNVQQPWSIAAAAPSTVRTQTVSRAFVASEPFLKKRTVSPICHYGMSPARPLIPSRRARLVCIRKTLWRWEGTWEFCELSGALVGREISDRRAQRFSMMDIRNHIALYYTLVYKPLNPKRTQMKKCLATSPLPSPSTGKTQPVSGAARLPVSCLHEGPTVLLILHSRLVLRWPW
jgi:hypothetical protein